MNVFAPASEWRNCADPTAGRRATTYGEGENMVGVTIKTLLRHQVFNELQVVCVLPPTKDISLEIPDARPSQQGSALISIRQLESTNSSPLPHRGQAL